jgi:catechol 2,3-dioxygenase-like lactoylglutathione lyase family enzyme
MLDHVGLNVNDYARSKAFYEKALAPLAFAADDRESVDAFHAAALDEAVCHKPAA